FLPALWFFSEVRPRWNPLLAFMPAFLLSLLWNGIMNWAWTFADHRRETEAAARQYFARSIFSGGAMFGLFAGLISLHVGILASGLTAAVIAMGLSGLLNQQSISRHVRGWEQITRVHGVQVILGRLSSELSADRAYLLAPGDE